MSSKQAVVLIDGIGEQKPMDTLRGFIDTVWSRNKDIHHDYAGSDTWSKPDSVSESFELRRITTPQNSAEITTDFFEFYWAHLMHGTSYGHVLAWARMLLLRHPATVPPQLKSIYWILVVMAVIAAALGSYAAISYANDRELSGSSLLSTFGSLVLLPVAGFIFRSVVGDAARYLHAAPTNIQRRHEVRQAGVKLLKALHDRGYERIILVGHSLGSVIGYDILTYGWVDYHLGRTAGATEMVALEEVERLAQGEMLESEVENIQRAQRAYFEELKINGNSWRVTDFVTLGSPLAHAAILLARNEDELKRKQADREFPTCLPWMETVTRNKQPVKRFSFELDSGKLYRVPHHAAPFAATRWTNLYFPCQNVLWGDLIGGKLREAMGFGVRDVPVFTKQRKGFLAHTLYWEYGKEADAPEHIKALRNALDLTDSRGCL